MRHGPARLPSRSRWEHAARDPWLDGGGQPRGPADLPPRPAGASDGRLRQVYGDCWEWTSSAYHPYPGFRAAPGAIGEYNGKFMSNQMVLRGGCALTPTTTCARPIATSSRTPRAGALTGCGWPTPSSRGTGATMSTPRQPVVDVRLSPDWAHASLVEDVRRGLGAQPRSLRPSGCMTTAAPSSSTRSPGCLRYYLTSCEREILATHAAAIARESGATTLVELGSGTSEDRLLLDAFTATGQLERFVPVDVSEARCARRPSRSQRPTRGSGRAVVGDFTRHLRHLPAADGG